MQKQNGDDFIRDLASFIRNNERGLAESGLARRRRGAHHARADSPSPSIMTFGWLSPGVSPSQAPKPVLFSTDTHHLFYLLMRLEALGLDIGPLDISVQSPSRPTSYANIYPEQHDTDTLSLASIRSSLSMVSKISIGKSWWSPEPASIDAELKYIYSSFTKLPALAISAPGKKAIVEMLDQSIDRNAVPLLAFKNLERLECDNIDPRTLLGWDRLAESLKSLKIKKSGLEDLSDIFIQAILDEQTRNAKNLPKSQSMASFTPSSLPDTVHEDEDPEDEEAEPTTPVPSHRISLTKWSSLRHLHLPDNGLTFFPTDLLPYLKNLTHLDLSSNLFVSVPPSFGELYNLHSLNLSDNLIDSVLGIYMNLGQILSLNLSRNRIESLCGLERLLALERFDLRHNLVEESSEISRLAVLPNITEIWIDGNPLVEIEDSYRIACFDYFWKEGKTIIIDGTQPSIFERRILAPSEPLLRAEPSAARTSTPIFAIEPSRPIHATPGPTATTQKDELSSTGFSTLAPADAGPSNAKARRSRKPKRIVDLNENNFDDTSSMHSRTSSGRNHTSKKKNVEAPPAPSFAVASTAMDRNPASQPKHSRHSRYQTEYAPSSQPIPPPPEFGVPKPFSSNNARELKSNTLSRADARKARVSASVFEPPTMTSEEAIEQLDVEEYRKTIESLKKDMGDSWLKVYSQTQSS
ncbi:hypothetical protein D9619_001855 [Psilocybe cf. subviscida]|uniref:Uncharacterized protein n=1 Tax=Psilocybe cf. subviscida TaxID=2480587 RepID=A0A8H5F3J2_9AGAR|nr:hypothetical protein D9619_001855 [Psilocybe cf. subviscida]